MRTALSRRGAAVVAIVVSAWVSWMGMAKAEPLSFKVPLSGGQEVPPVFTAGAGMADVTYDPATRAVSWKLSYEALSSPITTVDVHGPAQPSKNAPAELSLVKQGSPADNPINGQATLTPAQAQQFADGEWYFNIDTQNHPEGEIRGQILPPLPSHDKEGHANHHLRKGRH